MTDSAIVHTVVIFFAAMLIDVFYTLWFRFSAKGWEHLAALMSTLCGAAGLLGAWMVISQSIWYAIPDLIGLYLGTIVGLRFSKWLESRWTITHKPLTKEELAKVRILISK